MSDTQPTGQPFNPDEPASPTPPAAPGAPEQPSPTPTLPPAYGAPTYEPPAYASAPPPYQAPGQAFPPPVTPPGYGTPTPPTGFGGPPLPPSGYQAAYGGAGPSALRPMNLKALVGFILSAVGAAATFLTFFILSFLGLPLGIAGVIVGHLGLHDLKQRTDQRGRGLAIAALIIGYITIAVSLIAIILVIVAFIVGSNSNNCTSSGAGQIHCSYGDTSSMGTGV